MSLLWLDPLLSFLRLEDIARISSCSRVHRAKVKLTNVQISSQDFSRILNSEHSCRFFRRIIEPARINSLSVTLNPSSPRRAALLKILRAFTRCGEHEMPKLSTPETTIAAASFGYESSLTRLQIQVDPNLQQLSVPMRQEPFKGFCVHDLADTENAAPENCDHRSANGNGWLEEKFHFWPEAHEECQCWILRGDWRNIFRWFPKLADLEVPLSFGGKHSLERSRYIALMEFQIPRRGLASGEPDVCFHSSLRRLTLKSISDYTLFVEDGLSEVCEGATVVTHLSLSCLAESSRSMLGRFVRSIVATQTDGFSVEDDSQSLRDLSIERLRIRTAQEAHRYCEASNALVGTGFAASRNSFVIPPMDVYKRLAWTFSTVLSVSSRKPERCHRHACDVRSGCCATSWCAPLIFANCQTLSIDSSCLLAQEDLPHAFPNLRTLKSVFWLGPLHWESLKAEKTLCITRILSLLTALRTLTVVTIKAPLEFELSPAEAALESDSLVIEPELCPFRDRLLRSQVLDDLAASYGRIWMVLPVSHDGQERLVLASYDKKLLSPYIYFAVIAAGRSS